MCKCWMQWLPIAVIFMFFVLTLLTACGIKGPIYLPNEDADKQQKAAATEKQSTSTATSTTAASTTAASTTAAPTITATSNN